MKDVLGRLVKKIVDLPDDLLGVLYDLVDKLSGDSWQEWLTELKKFLRKEKCWVGHRVAVWKIWKTIKLGTHRDVKALRANLQKARRQISDWANDILGRITLSNAECEIELVLVKVKDLGFEQGATLKEIFNRALELGLVLCPAEVGPQLALQYLNQPLGEWARIAMEPISGSDDNLRLFRVERVDDGLWLRAVLGNPHLFWLPGILFVFARRK